MQGGRLDLCPDEQIVATLSRQLSWSHFVLLLPLKDPLQREYYAQMSCAERWSVRTLRGRIDSMLFERTALSRQLDALIAQELATMQDVQPMSPNLIMRDPYILDFLGLRDTWQESDLEAAIIREIESFLLELGVGFTFVARQKRIQLDGDDFYLDLLFYNRKLRRLVAWCDGTCMMSPMAAECSVTEAEIWSRTIRPDKGDLLPEAAREWLRLQLSDADAERVRELSSKANSGQLTGTEERELENYLNVGRTLQFLKAKARLSLCGHIPS